MSRKSAGQSVKWVVTMMVIVVPLAFLLWFNLDAARTLFDSARDSDAISDFIISIQEINH